MVNRKIPFFSICCLLFATVIFGQQVKVACYGATKNYFVDVEEGSVGTLGSSYEWTILEPNTALISGNGKNNVAIDWGTTVPGNYTVQVVETNNSCMSSTSVLTIKLRANPIVTMDNFAVCEGFSARISAQTMPMGATYQYSWSYPEEASNPGNVDSFETSIPGDYVVTVTDNYGCVSEAVTANLIVNSVPDAEIMAEGITKFCKGGSVVLTAPKGLVSYTWSKDGLLIDDGTPDSQYTIYETGGYTVTTKDANGCVNSTEYPFYVEVDAIPKIEVVASGPTEICDGTSVRLAVNTIASGYNFQWLDNGMDIKNQTEYVLTTSESASYSVRVVDENGCEATSAAIDVLVRPNPEATITNVTPVAFCAGEGVVLSVPSFSGYSYQWSDLKGPILGATNPTYMAHESSDYSIQIIDKNFPTYCTSRATKLVKVVKEILPVISEIGGD